MNQKEYKRLTASYSSKKISNSIKYLWILIYLFIIITSIGYAAIEKTLLISGEAIFRVEEDIRITDLKFISASNGGMEEYNSQYSKAGVITGINLPNLDSSVTYEVTVTNISNINMRLKDIINEYFSNTNIEYILIDISLNEVITGISTKVFQITFKYKPDIGIVPSDSILESRLEFVFVRNDSTPPVITEVNKPKIFYTTQTDSIDLASYATAVDDIDGDITDRIVITSTPDFDKNRVGIYEITYNVQDEAGNSAAPLKIMIVIWNFVKVESGRYHTLALTSHGRVYAWGYNNAGQVGKGSSGDASTPVQLNLRDVVDIAANGLASYAVTKDGKIYSWGEGTDGKLGDGTTSNRNSPGLVTTPSGVKFIKINAQVSSIAALTDTGDVYTWGYNNVGQLGDGATTTRTTPIKINLSNIVEVSQGGNSGAAIDRDGVLYTWGSDTTYDLLGNQADSGTRNLPGTYSGLTNIKFVQVCNYHVIAISNSGQVYTWGEGANGKLGNGSTSNSKTPYATSIKDGEQASRSLVSFIS